MNTFLGYNRTIAVPLVLVFFKLLSEKWITFRILYDYEDQSYIYSSRVLYGFNFRAFML